MDSDDIRYLCLRLMGAKNVYWRDPEGKIHKVLNVKLDWVEFADEPKLKEPAALLEGGKAVALRNTTLDTFVTVQSI